MYRTPPDKIEQLIDKAERIGVIGSPSTTSKLSLDILASAVSKKLVGEFALFRYMQDGQQHYALGQITEVSLKNVWHEDPTMRSLIRQRGKVDAVSERQDTHQGEMTVSAVFANDAGKYRPSIIGTVPPTGTSILLVDEELIKMLLKPYEDQLFYLGHVYGSTPKLPLWFKHFDEGTNGAGEAYHLGIFGKTGSGKSVLAKMILLAYAKHKKMGLFVFDPQGEFSKSLQVQKAPASMGNILNPLLLKGMGRKLAIYDLYKIQLDRWELFAELLTEFGFFFDLGIKSSEYQAHAADYVESFLRDKKYRMETLNDQSFFEVLDYLSNNIQRIYANQSGSERVQQFIREARQNVLSGTTSRVKEKWDRTTRFFKAGKDTRTPSQIISSVLNPTSSERPLVVINLSQKPTDISQSVWDDKIKPLLIDRFITELIADAERAYQGERSLNTLVVFDEAHRLASQGKSSNERMGRIKSNLIDAVRTTRKYGLGWMFLSQTLSSLDTEIVQQLRIFFFGFGLSMGTEYQKLRELIGDKDSLRLYQSFRDPQSAFDMSSREYAYMTVGPVSPLSFAGTPLFLKAFNKVTEFTDANTFYIQNTLLADEGSDSEFQES